MVKLSYEEFMKLSDREKCLKYKNLNDFDKYRSRMTEPIVCGKSIDYIELTNEQKIKGKNMIEQVAKLLEK